LTGVLNIKKELPICKSIWQNSAMIKPNYPKHVGMGEELLIISQGEVIARVLPPLNEKEKARAELMKLSQKCKI